MKLVTILCLYGAKETIDEVNQMGNAAIKSYIAENILGSMLKEVKPYDKENFEFTPQRVKAAKPRVFTYIITELEEDKANYFITYKQEILQQVHSEISTKTADIINHWADKEDHYILIELI